MLRVCVNGACAAQRDTSSSPAAPRRRAVAAASSCSESAASASEPRAAPPHGRRRALLLGAPSLLAASAIALGARADAQPPRLTAEGNVMEYMPSIADKDYGKPRMLYSDFVLLDDGLQYKDLREGTGATPRDGNRCVVDWAGYTIGYYGRPFEARNKSKGGAFTGDDKDYLRFTLGAGAVIPAFEEAVRGMKARVLMRGAALALAAAAAAGGASAGGGARGAQPGGIRRVVVPAGPLSYPQDALRSLGPRPTTFSGQRALDFVMENRGMIDKTLLFDIELIRVEER